MSIGRYSYADFHFLCWYPFKRYTTAKFRYTKI